MASITNNPLFAQVVCILDELNVVYTDCDGVIQGDCGMCAGSAGGIVTNTVAFNPGSNQLTTVVNGIAANTILAFDTGDIYTTSSLTINGVLYPAPTLLQTILNAIVAISHVPASVNPTSNPALTIIPSTQELNLDLSAPGSYDNSVSGLTADNVQDAITELLTASSGLPSGSVGDILIHNGTEFVPAQRITDDLSGFTGINLVLSLAPASYAPFELYRGGALMTIGDDYSRVGVNITLVAAANNLEMFKAIYYV